jgi:hypothetical protein
MTVATCFDIQSKHINILCEQNVEFSNDKPGGTYSNHWALRTYRRRKEWIIVIRTDLVRHSVLDMEIPSEMEGYSLYSSRPL